MKPGTDPGTGGRHDALRADVWRIAYDDQLSEGGIIENLLGALGMGLGAARALFLESGTDGLACTREWHAGSHPGSALGARLRPDNANGFPATGARLIDPSDIHVPAPAGNRSPLGTWPILAAVYQVQGRTEGAFALQADPEKEPWGDDLITLLKDLSEVVARACAHRRSETALRQSELRYRIISELCSDWAFSWTVRADGTPAYEWSTARGTVAGYSTRELSSVEAWYQLLHPEDRVRAEEAYRRNLRNEATFEGYRIRTRFEEERWVEVKCQPVWDGVAGRVARVFGLVHDATDRVNAERAVRQERDLVRTILEASPDGIFVVSLGDVIVDCNAAAWRIAGCRSREEMIGRPVSSLIADGDREQAATLRAQVRAGHRVDGVRLTGRTIDGHDFPLELSIGLVRAPSGEPWGFVGAIKNLTERLELDARVLQAQKAESLGVLAGGVAHDFNNLLAAIVGSAGLALASLPSGSPARSDLEHIVTAAERAADLTRQLVAYAGKGRLVVERIDLSQLINEMARLLESFIEGKCALRLELARSLPKVEGDAKQLQQVVLNLVLNASEAIGNPPGIVVLRTGARRCDRAYLSQAAVGADLPEDEYVFIEVADDGSGMSCETMVRIFDPFFTTKFAGRGLGLPAVQGIVRAHSGAVMVDSELGRGTTFRILLPAQRRADIAPEPGPVVPVTPGGKVLVADDEDLVRHVARVMLERAGYQIEEAKDGRQALELVGRDPASFRLVLLDLRMPELGGEKALPELRQMRADLPVLVSSGLPGTMDIDDPLVDFVQKPFTRQELLTAVERLLSAASSRHGPA